MTAPLDLCPARYGTMHYPERQAWLDASGSWSYRELDQRVSLLCQRLRNNFV